MTIFRSIRWKVTSAYLFTIIIAIPLLGIYLARWTENHYIQTLRSNLEAESRLIGHDTAPLFSGDPQAIDRLARQASSDLGRRVTLVRLDGTVVGESHSDFHNMEPHGGRPEIARAREQGSGWSIRHSQTLSTRTMYVATRIDGPSGPVGFARMSETLAQVDRALKSITGAFFIATLIAFAVAAYVGYRLSTNITLPILEMNKAARRLAKGELDHRIKVPDTPRDELDELAAVLNTMAVELHAMMEELGEEKGMLETILARTDDGLIVVDNEARIRMANPTAERLLGTSFDKIHGHTVIEGTLSHDLSEMVKRVLRTGAPASLQIELSSPVAAYLNVYVASLERPGGNFGAVVVMHDQTEARRIDSVRQDFVANVSHEFRTPLAAMKAMAETIALRGRKDPEAAVRFAEKIMVEADRLTALSDDLLDLAEIEAGISAVRRDRFALSEVADRIISEYGSAADRKGVYLKSHISPDITVHADKDAVYQIMLNLVDNAIKYTQEGGMVDLTASSTPSRVDVKVTDTGIGIPQEDLSRIFERFYRVDRARSRESGGTGLGLSIVKHLVEEHGGKVTVESTPNLGTTFTFTLPSAMP